jgi:alpha-glucosidase
VSALDRDWWKRAVFYQVYPRSFADSNGDGVGDLPGITAHLDHLNDGTPDSLGVDAIWISPFYRSPMADFGYDVADYRDVDPVFGSLADFDELVARAHGRDIRVVVDFVPNHTSDRHPWFRESRSSRTNPRRDWYVWADPAPDGGPPNNWQSRFRIGRAWTFDERTGQYYLHSFLPDQPDLNWWNPAVREEFEAILRFWLDRGVDGFRVDVAHMMLQDPELRDNPKSLIARSRRMDEDWPEVHEIHRSWRRLLDSYGDRMAVGEVFVPDPKRMAAYYGAANDELHLVFNFTFLRQPWVASAFREATESFERVLPAGAWPDYTLSNHDVGRARSRYDSGAGGGRGPVGLGRARVAAMMLLTLRGTPFIYYGEEIGQADAEVPPERAVDVDGRDPERAPMQWAPGRGAGFTTGEPWLPIGSEADRVNVAAQRGDQGSMLSLYRRLIWYRKRSAPLLHGIYRSLDAPEGVFAFVREAAGEALLVALNFTNREVRFDAAALSPARSEGVDGDGSAAGAEPRLGAGRPAAAELRAVAQPPAAPRSPAHGILELSTVADRPTGLPVSLRPLSLGPIEGVVVQLGRPEPAPTV